MTKNAEANPTGAAGTMTESTAAEDVANETLWQVQICPVPGQPDRLAESVLDDARELGIGADLSIAAARGFLLQGRLNRDAVLEIANGLLTEPVVEVSRVGVCGDDVFDEMPSSSFAEVFHVLPLPGVTDAEAESAAQAIELLGHHVTAVRTFRKYWTTPLDEESRELFCRKLIANESIEQVVVGKLFLKQIQLGRPYRFELQTIPMLQATDDELLRISQQHQLSLTLVEMQTIQAHFAGLGREPTDAELETIAQTWSEHCSHKTLAGRVDYEDENGRRHFDNMLKETIFNATVQIRELLGDDDWCVSVFRDNAGVVRFDDRNNLAFKVETHNRPSALEPYGGANTGIGGVIRDTLGTGMGAKPICSTDVFCFAPPDVTQDDLPPGVLHPRMIMKGVVAGVRDYGNRMGIPTVNGAVYFDPRYVGNPLVFCGNVGLIPHEHSFKHPQANDLIVVIGGRTGRDGIHGATFSSAELTESSDITSGGAVQIGNAITEKMLADVLLQARDQGLYHAVTDCGAGGFSSAVGEMGEEIGAEVWLDKAPLKYEGLSYTEIWISESQERMVLAVPEEKWTAFQELCASESVEAAVIGRFSPTGRLVLKYQNHEVGNLEMAFLHDGRPPVVRRAVFQPVKSAPKDQEGMGPLSRDEAEQGLLRILGSLNVASKHWIIRQYDHEVQGGSVVKPLVGVANDGPSDAAVVRPVFDHYRGVAIACGMNPYYGDIDPYHMAASSIDEAIRNCVAVGANPDRIAILDNFCWGYTDRPETLGSLVRAALACHDVAIAFRTPFISGKDSLNNEFSYTDADGRRQTISIPCTLLISAMGQVDDVRQCITMDLKSSGNWLYQLGSTGSHLGGSHWNVVTGATGGGVPTVQAEEFRDRYQRLYESICRGTVRSCHDLSEGGLAVAVAEMAFAGGLGLNLELRELAEKSSCSALEVLFSESNGRFLVEVEPQHREEFEARFGADATLLGQVSDGSRLNMTLDGTVLVDLELSRLKQAWRQPLDWH